MTIRDELEARHGAVWLSSDGTFAPLTMMGEYHLINLHLKLTGTLRGMKNSLEAAELFNRPQAEYEGKEIDKDKLTLAILGVSVWLNLTKEELARRELRVNREVTSRYTYDEIIARI